jgi:hypothetical protein
MARKERTDPVPDDPRLAELVGDALTSDAEPDQQLVVYTAAPGSRSERALRELAAWAAEHIPPPSLIDASTTAKHRSAADRGRVG